MNFTREPILETIIAAKDGYKLRLKSTKHEGAQEYVVDAIEVVSFGTTFFYRSLETMHTFFVPAQDFEIVQVRQARLLLKTPSEKAVKIAGGAESSKKPSEKTPEKKKKRVKAKSTKEDKKEEVKPSEKKSEQVEGAKAEEKVDAKKEKVEKRVRTKSAKKTVKKKVETEPVDKEVVQPSMFSHLLRPPEALISDNIHQYKDMIDSQNEEKKEETFVNVTSEVVETKVDDKATEDVPVKKVEEEKPLSLKEKMKKVLAPALKEPTKREDSSE